MCNAQQIEVEDEISEVSAEKGKVSVQKEVFWSKDLLFFEAQGPGARMNGPIEIPDDGQYKILAPVTPSMAPMPPHRLRRPPQSKEWS